MRQFYSIILTKEIKIAWSHAVKDSNATFQRKYLSLVYLYYKRSRKNNAHKKQFPIPWPAFTRSPVVYVRYIVKNRSAGSAAIPRKHLQCRVNLGFDFPGNTFNRHIKICFLYVWTHGRRCINSIKFDGNVIKLDIHALGDPITSVKQISFTCAQRTQHITKSFPISIFICVACVITRISTQKSQNWDEHNFVLK